MYVPGAESRDGISGEPMSWCARVSLSLSDCLDPRILLGSDGSGFAERRERKGRGCGQKSCWNRCTCLVSLQCVVQERRAGLGAEVVGGGEGEGRFPPHPDEPGWGGRSGDVHTTTLGRKKEREREKKQLNIHQSH